MKLNRLSALVIASSFLLTACLDDDDDDNTSATASIRAIHAVPDAPPVNINLNGSAAVSDLDYARSSGFASVSTGTYDVGVEAIIPGGNSTVISVDDLALATNSRTTVFAVGTVDATDSAALEALPVAEATATPASDEVSIRVVHAAPVASDVDIYITAPGASLAGLTPIDADYKDTAELTDAVPAVSYQIRITADGNSANVLYDSGSVDLSAFAGQKLVVAAINTTTQAESDASPVKLLAVNDTTQLELLDQSTQAGAKVVHLSPDAGTAVGAVEVFANDAVELIDSFTYTEVVAAADSYALVAAGSYDFDVSPDDGSNLDLPAANFSLDGATLAAGSETTVIAVGYVATTPEFDLIASADQNRAYGTHARVKVIHGAAAVGNVNVFVAAAGTYTANDIESGNGPTALLSDFAFKGDSGYVDIAAGSYDIFVQDATSDTVVIAATGVAIANGNVVTAIARGPDGDGDPAAAGLLLLTN